MKDFTNAEIWSRKVTELDPKNKEAFYTLGVIPWTEFLRCRPRGPNQREDDA